MDYKAVFGEYCITSIHQLSGGKLGLASLHYLELCFETMKLKNTLEKPWRAIQILFYNNLQV